MFVHWCSREQLRASQTCFMNCFQNCFTLIKIRGGGAVTSEGANFDVEILIHSEI